MSRRWRDSERKERQRDEATNGLEKTGGRTRKERRRRRKRDVGRRRRRRRWHCHLTKECRDLTRISLTAVRREGDGKYEGKKSGEAASRLSARKNLLNRPFVRYVVSVALKTREGRKLSGRMTAQDQPLRLNVISIAVERENRVVTDSSRQNRIFITRDTRVTISTNRTNRRERARVSRAFLCFVLLNSLPPSLHHPFPLLHPGLDGSAWPRAVFRRSSER